MPFTISWYIDTAALMAGASCIAYQYGPLTGIGLGLLAYFIGSRLEAKQD